MAVPSILSESQAAAAHRAAVQRVRDSTARFTPARDSGPYKVVEEEGGGVSVRHLRLQV
jgi:hypothetical protein